MSLPDNIPESFMRRFEKAGNPSRAEKDRQEVEDATERYLKAGGTIKQIPSGVGVNNPMGNTLGGSEMLKVNPKAAKNGPWKNRANTLKRIQAHKLSVKAIADKAGEPYNAIYPLITGEIVCANRELTAKIERAVAELIGLK